MSNVLAFDVYGTLINTWGINQKLGEMIGCDTNAFSRMWRDKQLEYSFRRGLMKNYAEFSVCTRDALNYTCRYFSKSLSDEQKNQLLRRYRSLPAFDDVQESLETLQSSGFNLYAFSNGSPNSVDELLISAGLRDFFIEIISTDDMKSFKPDPAVYSYLLRRTGGTLNTAWLISSNPFDVIGAVSAGLKSAWVQRSKEMVFDPWGIEPTMTVESLTGLAALVSDQQVSV